MSYSSRDTTVADLYTILPIWKHYVETSLLCYETYPANFDWLKAQFSSIKAARLPYFVTFDGERLVGWAFLRPFSTITDVVFRYNAVAESWVDPAYLSRGVGQHQQKLLLQKLVGLPIRNVSVLYTEQQASHLAEFGLNFPGLEELGMFQEIVDKLGSQLSVKMANLVLGEESTAPKL
jgi:L-amino acid N-acyltransferase YncA